MLRSQRAAVTVASKFRGRCIHTTPPAATTATPATTARPRRRFFAGSGATARAGVAPSADDAPHSAQVASDRRWSLPQ
jgi:hypothetical protein